MLSTSRESQMINIYGGSGGAGGRGRNRGGRGGTGEGPIVTLNSYHVQTEASTLRNGSSTPEWAKDFEVVKLGHLRLVEETHDDVREDCLSDQGVVHRQPKVVGARRVYRARIFGHQDPMTAVVWVSEDSRFRRVKDTVMNAQRFRNPHFAQLFGLICSSGLNALVYHDEMMAISQVQSMHSHSRLASRYLNFVVVSV
ncbi:hypothetical protein FB45DRAFT_230277 [Roridomyces roridus]|uniref:Uncharacterized protein n=1 Tax=Roridomyces roridus TaxID=1738132 RepID=A0AAD7FCZ9_9AGAR|nr:hypothetical protein FB45DRAFT_230277 [Roridomyces roridus]